MKPQLRVSDEPAPPSLLCPDRGKVGYVSERAAKKARRKFYRSKHFHERDGRLSVYRCEHCHWWHMGNTQR